MGRQQTVENMSRVSEEADVIAAAAEAMRSGRRVFACVVTIGHSSGGALGFGGQRSTTTRDKDAGPLVEALEAAGWRLDRWEPLWLSTNRSSNMVEGLTRLHMLPSRVGNGTSR